MPKEAIDYLDERMTEFFQELREMRTMMHREHRELSEKQDELKDRVSKLEHDGKVTRWVFSGWGLLFGFLIRELIRRWWM